MIEDLLATYGYVALFGLVFLESLGVPLPGETALLTAAALSATGRLAFPGVLLAAAAGAIAGDACGYWIGRIGGLRLLQRYGRLIRLDDRELEKGRRFFQRHGGKTVFLGRFVALLRTTAALLAGVNRMPYLRFTLFNAAGGICWTILVSTLGYGFGHNLPAVERWVGQAGAMAVLLVALLVALPFVGGWIVRHRKQILEWVARTLERLGVGRITQAIARRYPRTWAFLGRRFSKVEYLGLHLTIGLLLSLGALWIFASIAMDVVHHDPITQFDIEVAKALHAHGSPAALTIATTITLAGSPIVIVPLALLVGAILIRRRQWVFLVGWLTALVGGAVLDGALKILFRRPRPVWNDPWAMAHGWSFPSGHAMGSLVAYGMIAYLAIAEWPRWSVRLAVIGGVTLLVLLIGLTRLYLGVHYFSDVVGGYAAGAVWLATCISACEVARRRSRSTAQPDEG
jgi:membrane protein DedA with SNARE-associated domain/membrane-associated phospholipid phosphatase